MKNLLLGALAAVAFAFPAAAQISGDVVRIAVLTDLTGLYSDNTGKSDCPLVAQKG